MRLLRTLKHITITNNKPSQNYASVIQPVGENSDSIIGRTYSYYEFNINHMTSTHDQRTYLEE
jgi:hypothetical protein